MKFVADINIPQLLIKKLTELGHDVLDIKKRNLLAGVCSIIGHMAAIDWTHIYKKYKGLWVALMDDEVTVITSGKTAKEVWEKAEKKGFKEPILMNVPKKLTYFVGKTSKK